MKNTVKTDDIIFNFFKQICDEKDDKKCIELGNSWINAMESNLTKMELNLNDQDKIKYKVCSAVDQISESISSFFIETIGTESTSI